MTPNNLPGPWFNADRMAEFWGYVKWYMKYNMPIFMMVMAVPIAYMVLTLVVDIPLKAKKEYEKSEKDDDDFDVKYY